jgi:hypothetical protein
MHNPLRPRIGGRVDTDQAALSADSEAMPGAFVAACVRSPRAPPHAEGMNAISEDVSRAAEVCAADGMPLFATMVGPRCPVCGAAGVARRR